MTSNWYLRPRPNPAARWRLIYFPYAGSGVAPAVRWATQLDSQFELCLVKLPGRESRMKEAAFVRMEPLVAELDAALTPLLDRPFAFFGHSMGALLAFELTRRLRRRGAALPRALFVSGRDAPQMPDTSARIHHLPDTDFLTQLRARFATGIPDAVWQNEDVMRFFLPTLRADFAVIETYLYRPEQPLPLPIVAFGSRADDEISADGITAWQQQTSAAFAEQWFDGDHFYLQHDPAPLLQAVAGHAGRLLAPT